MAYATFEDLVLRYPDLGETPEDRANAILEDASMSIDRVVRPYGGFVNFDANALRMVCCNIAARFLYQTASGVGMDVSQMSTTVGSISEQVTFTNGSGNCKVLRSDRENLGIPGGRIGSCFLGGC